MRWQTLRCKIRHMSAAIWIITFLSLIHISGQLDASLESDAFVPEFFCMKAVPVEYNTRCV